MLRKLVATGLFALLLWHTLASVVIGVVGWWQAEKDLSERLLVYRSVDSMVEFQIPVTNQTDSKAIARTTEDGFRYRGHDYNVVSLEVQGDTLHIVGLESKPHSIWQDDLLSFVNNHLATPSGTGQKANQLLKLLLKEYSPASPTVLSALLREHNQSVRVPQATIVFTTRTAPIHSPPPEWAS